MCALVIVPGVFLLLLLLLLWLLLLRISLRHAGPGRSCCCVSTVITTETTTATAIGIERDQISLWTGGLSIVRPSPLPFLLFPKHTQLTTTSTYSRKEGTAAFCSSVAAAGLHV
jgi:hypothetical protein